MKKLFLFLAIASLTGCDSIFAPITFKIIGRGTFDVGLSQNGDYSSTTISAQSIDVNNSGIIVLSAQSTQGTGVIIEAYLGNELIERTSSSGYGVAMLTIEN
jgi:hypothetical protein